MTETTAGEHPFGWRIKTLVNGFTVSTILSYKDHYWYTGIKRSFLPQHEGYREIKNGSDHNDARVFHDVIVKTIEEVVKA